MTAYKRRFSAFDRRLMNAVSPARSGVLDHVLPVLGRTADHSRLWLAIAGAMASIGDIWPDCQ